MKNLVIVESPNKIASLEKYLGKDYQVLASVGHIVYLPSTGEHRFGVDMETWSPNYKIDPSKKKVVNGLKAALKDKKEVYIATDPDREGEAIGDNLVNFLKLKNYHRIRFNEITKNAVLEAIKKPTKIDEKLVNSQIARRILDRIIGYKLSNLMRNKINNSPISPSAGRVQSIALKLVVEREKEIEKFVPIKYVVVDAKINDDVVASLISGNFHGKKEWINPKDILKISKDFKGLLKVVSVKTFKRNDNKKIPLKQSALYKRADSALGMSSRAIQFASQRLYEGYGDGGLISYPRTDSTRLSLTFVSNAKKYISNKFGSEYVATEIKGMPGAQDAHEAIRPTNLNLLPEEAASKFNLSANESKIYKLIYNHTLMSLIKPATREILRYELTEGSNTFRMSSSKVIFEGYLKIVGYEKSKELPKYRENEILQVKDYDIKNLETLPPPRYNDGSLIEKLDDIEVGRPSTFMPTINILKDRMYVDLEGKTLKATNFGKLVFQKLFEAFPEIINEKYTANMEKELDEVAKGNINYKNILEDFWNFFEKDLETATQSLSLTTLSAIPAGKDCEKCSNPLVVRVNKRDRTKFFACSNFPECKHTENDPNQKRKFIWKKKKNK